MNHYKYLLLSVAVSLGAVSCSLEEDASSITSPYDFYQNAAQVRAALNACYIPLSSIYTLAYEIAVEGTTDLASTNYSAQKDAKLDISPASTGCGSTVWLQCYTGVRYCLSTIAGIERSPMDQEDKNPLMAEARIMLSYYYYLLTSFFGDVPFYEDYVETVADIDRIGSLGRMSANDTRSQLIGELRQWTPMLDQIRSSEVENNYCGAAMGWMVMAKMAAWNKDWNAVLEACAHLEDIYGDLNQYPYSDVMFRNKNTPESIFEIQHTWTAGGLSKTATVASICMPYPRTTGTNIYDSVTIEDLGSQCTTYRPMQPTSYFKTSVLRSGVGDIRRDYTLVTSWNGVSFPGSRCWLGPKFWCPGMYAYYDSNNYKVFRYADALLLMAEAYCEQGEYSSAISYLNKVRNRAGLSNYGSFDTYIKLREEIRKERARELFGEFGRKYDLVRWGVWYQQVLASGGALDNKEYDKYGLGE